MNRIVNALGKLNWGMRAHIVFVCATTAIALPAQTLTTLFSFDYTHGANPYAGLLQGTDGNLYGTAFGGGANLGGTIFKITPSGALTTLYNFCSLSECADGQSPSAGLVQAGHGDFFGTTATGGNNGSDFGTVFKISPGGALTTLYSFCAQGGVSCTDGANPYAGLVQATSGNFFGTTYGGGAHGGGTVFVITPSGTLRTLYSFCAQSGCTDGQNPEAGLVQATNGDLYGTTFYGGANCAPYGCGTVFKITPSGTLQTLYSFCAQSGCTDGFGPQAGLVQAANGDLYGATVAGGANGATGTVFSITPSGTLTTLHSFCTQSGCPDGEEPVGALVQATDGALYGTTQYGGANLGGTIFKITARGTLTTLYNFCSHSGCTDGQNPRGGLVQDTNGNLYGTTEYGGISGLCPANTVGCGTVFSLSVGLGPFVESRPASGEVGESVEILGSNLTGATSVTFNGTAAAFTVVSRYLITTTVPAGASSGTIQVVTPGGTLSSNVAFRVTP